MSEQLTVRFREVKPPPEVPIEAMDDEEALDSAGYHHREKCRAEALFLRSLARLAEHRPPGRRGIDLGDGAAEEVAMELNLSPNTTSSQIAFAQALVKRLGATVDALEAGAIDYMCAKAMHDYTADLDDDQASRVERRVLDGGQRENLTRFKHSLRREVIRADPAAANERRRLARAKRDVTKWDKPDGTTSLTITMEPHEAQAAYARITSLAEQAGSTGRSLAHRKADVFMDLVLGKESKQPPVAVNVLVPMTTLMGLNQEPGEISGYGPITAEYARELAQNATWRRVLTDPSGQVLEVSRRRFASPTLKRHIQMRDRVCRQPGCTVPAERCQTDHTKTYASGGLTAQDNTAMFCKRHNLMRQRTNWRIEQIEPGTLVFHTPASRTVVTTPERYEIPPF
ncbi:HNH endonuclease signature motif containing protein [Kibdelosporangium persicum]|uniref:HNH endonuclease n=1 Tax=Kibdelosporangium persicum TaxID=2698649 RepID=A0ABX2EVY9_9PSEU|nr:HNH endonuclease signature motif containing protein [Kibdelosporangium persicum]NRN62912.1 HNH endonuclease [Kibdelosporangium persicum]